MKLRIRSGVERIFQMLTSDYERMKYWAEKSRTRDNIITFSFPNGQAYQSEVLEVRKNDCFKIIYFNSIVEFRITGDSDPDYCILELINSGIPETEYCENMAGWVSVLMTLKAYAEHGVDLRNHHPDYTWDKGFIDN